MLVLPNERLATELTASQTREAVRTAVGVEKDKAIATAVEAKDEARRDAALCMQKHHRHYIYYFWPTPTQIVWTGTMAVSLESSLNGQR